MSKIPIQFPRYLVNKYKTEAIEYMNSYINTHSNEFISGETITLRYKDVNGNLVSSNAVVNVDEQGKWFISIAINEGETEKIVYTQNVSGPQDKNALWLSDFWGDDIITSGNTKQVVNSLIKEIKRLTELVNKHEYALNNTLCGGDIVVNSQKYDLENEYSTIQPDDSTYTPSYTTGDTRVTEFSAKIGNTDLIEYGQQLHKKQKYYFKLHFYNVLGEEVEETSAITIDYQIISPQIGNPQITLDTDRRMFFAETSGNSVMQVSVTNSGETSAITINYPLTFIYNEKPEYKVYEEPNVHHMLQKKGKTLEIIQDNFQYLLEGEFCWCVGDNTLYFKAEASNGTIQLFKINGGGVAPTGSGVTYTINDDGILNISDPNHAISIDDNGYINLVGASIDDEGYLILNNSLQSSNT